MAIKSSNVMARVEPDVKEQAERILSQLGLPVSVAINLLYRQIIMRNGLPFPMTIPVKPMARDQMSVADFDAMMSRGLQQDKEDDSIQLDEAFDNLRRGI
ncbi:MAG: type II toxin-antitoxin system RelB/DinJ family antitoxin [Clostridia bacterium]|nr:type II toxin-antitoxin system RelB/DinJ family antitoxin [Clostridia bacterium]